MKLDINDPRITQYALNEMPEDERKAFEKEIDGNPEILKEIEEIKQFSNVMEEGFEADPKLSLSDSRKKIVENHSKPQANSRIAFKVILSLAATFVAAFIVMQMTENPVRSFFASAKSSFGSCEGEHDLQINVKVAPIDSAKILPKGMTEIPATPLPSPDPTNVQVDKKAPSVQCTPKPEILKSESERLRVRSMSSPKKMKALHGVAPMGRLPMMAEESRRPSESWRYNGNFNTENYSRIVENQYRKVMDHPLSTFSIDVDTASYANVRRFINQSSLPPADAVRIEELINYFDYEYPSPEDKPFSVNFEMATCPWNTKHRLVRIGLKGKEIAKENRPNSNLVFLLDVSGSMSSQNKLPLLKKSMKLLLEQLSEKDRVAIVVYAGASGLALPSTTADNKETIMAALERLNAGGSTNGGAGIKLAYKTAAANFIKGGINRVILATDGDFNVGVTGEGALERLIEKKAKSGVFLSVLGFGMGNYKDNNLEKLSGKGNGNYAYIDTLNEAKKVLVNEMGSTLITIAKDVKIQVEFNPALVEAYRLIGYENRMLKKEDFNDDKKDAGEIGAGHTVTAFYEIVPKGVEVPTPKVDELKYQKPKPTPKTDTEFDNEIMTVKLRYKEPDGDKSKLLTFPLKNEFKEFGSTSDDFKFATAVVEFGLLLRNSQFKGNATFESAIDLAEKSYRNDKFGYRKEFLGLLKKAARIKAMQDK